MAKTIVHSATPGWVPCVKCPLLECNGLRPLDKGQVVFMQSFKQGQVTVQRGAQLLAQGSSSPHLFTVLDGVLMRYRLQPDGRRQILNFMFPGDLIGLQGALDDALEHSVEAMADAVLCIFGRDRLPELYREQPRLAFDISWLAAKEESALEQHLVSIGLRKARERIASLALFLVDRGAQSGFGKPDRIALAMNQGQIAETLGLSSVHTNRSLQYLRGAKLLRWSASAIEIPDVVALRAFAGIEPREEQPRPYI